MRFLDYIKELLFHSLEMKPSAVSQHHTVMISSQRCVFLRVCVNFTHNLARLVKLSIMKHTECYYCVCKIWLCPRNMLKTFFLLHSHLCICQFNVMSCLFPRIQTHDLYGVNAMHIILKAILILLDFNMYFILIIF